MTKREGGTHPGRAADDVGELLDELARAGDDFVGLLLHRMSAKSGKSF